MDEQQVYVQSKLWKLLINHGNSPGYQKESTREAEISRLQFAVFFGSKILKNLEIRQKKQHRF